MSEEYMPRESKAARTYRAAEAHLRNCENAENRQREHWESANARVEQALEDGRSDKTVKKARNYERNAREKYEEAKSECREAKEARDRALERLEIEEISR
ncbi:hypothetical protein LOZ53_006082 [Ophidiomyces ophidiicola]|nr:hypothetical protein LOZ55_000537 [Ophidiomyces ophidiicola]KAI1982218.1 hypothetical protein LOZ54_005406 [Ophidiomyces ophidiicola]KAI1982973.1 hypothetical protein LOZ53_006082 [Ophidiomyces ophidiicola]KAI1989415.1 hypothetical protein LOZ51_005228 [Ophidiomyces ophidiicola]